MGALYDKLNEDFRLEEALNACMSCGVCTAICPAAEFYHYDPRAICTIVQSRDDAEIEKLLKSDTIWYCGQCMSCKTRCPRGNTPGIVISVLRTYAQKMGYFVENEKGRQQYAIEQTVGQNILKHGYCVHPDIVTVDKHPEQGPVWEWYMEHIAEVSPRFGAKYHQRGAGAIRDIAEDDLKEMKAIFDVTGGSELYRQIEEKSAKYAEEHHLPFDENYMQKVFTEDSGCHSL